MEYPYKLIDNTDNYQDVFVPETNQIKAADYADNYRKKAPQDSDYILVNGGYNNPPQFPLTDEGMKHMHMYYGIE